MNDRLQSNINHPFIRFVNKNRDTFKGGNNEDHEFLIGTLSDTGEGGLFGRLLGGYLMPLKEIQRMQKHLLDFYVEKGILTKEEAESYLLTEKDFCLYDMGVAF